MKYRSAGGAAQGRHRKQDPIHGVPHLRCSSVLVLGSQPYRAGLTFSGPALRAWRSARRGVLLLAPRFFSPSRSLADLQDVFVFGGLHQGTFGDLARNFEELPGVLVPFSR